MRLCLLHCNFSPNEGMGGRLRLRRRRTRVGRLIITWGRGMPVFTAILDLTKGQLDLRG